MWRTSLLTSNIELERGGLARFSQPSATKTALLVDEALIHLVDHLLPRLAQPTVIRVPSGEAAKTLHQAERVWQAMERAQMDRQACVIALGGGATCDLAGFVASCYLRGVRLILIPTSLLGMVDAAIGGKNGVNGVGGKNRIGTTYLPELTLIDPSCLETLPMRQWRSGWAEVIKCAVIQGEASIAWLEAHAPLLRQQYPATVDAAIQMAIQTKIQCVSQDLDDRSGLRARLNFGHTFAHALEAYFDYERLTHGEAVAIGMSCAAQLSIELGLIEPDWKERLDGLCLALGLPVHLPEEIDPQRLQALMARDKKWEAGQLTCLVASNWGQVTRQNVSEHFIERCLDKKALKHQYICSPAYDTTR